MIEIRAALPDEYEQVGELVVAAYLLDGVVAANSPYLDELRDARRRAAHAELLVATSPTVPLAGTVTWCVAGNAYAELAREGEAEFRMLAVAPAARGQGVGRALVEACVRRARERGHRALVLCTTGIDGPAVRLYERLGFVRDATRDWAPVPEVPLYAYALALESCFCDQCGEPAEAGGHPSCDDRRALEPPRYCPRCRRRMVVQVTPRGWSARCAAHGLRRA